MVSSNSPKKQTNEFVVVVKTNSFVRFLGEFEDTKSPFEIIWPLERKWEISYYCSSNTIHFQCFDILSSSCANYISYNVSVLILWQLPPDDWKYTNFLTLFLLRLLLIVIIFLLSFKKSWIKGSAFKLWLLIENDPLVVRFLSKGMELSKIGPNFRKKNFSMKPTKIRVDFFWIKVNSDGRILSGFLRLCFFNILKRYLIFTKVCCRAFFEDTRSDCGIGDGGMCNCRNIFHSIRYLIKKSDLKKQIPRWFSMQSQCSAWLLRVKLYCCIVCGLRTFKVKKDFFLNLTFVRQKSGLQQGMFLKV